MEGVEQLRGLEAPCNFSGHGNIWEPPTYWLERLPGGPGTLKPSDLAIAAEVNGNAIALACWCELGEFRSLDGYIWVC